MEYLPSINKVYFLVSQEENNITPVNIIDESIILANA